MVGCTTQGVVCVCFFLLRYDRGQHRNYAVDAAIVTHRKLKPYRMTLKTTQKERELKGKTVARGEGRFRRLPALEFLSISGIGPD